MEMRDGRIYDEDDAPFDVENEGDVAVAELRVSRNGALTIAGCVIGRFDAQEQRLILNLGWTTLAGVSVTVYGDPEEDRRRIVLERDAEGR